MKYYCGFLPLEWIRKIDGKQGNAAALRVGILIWHRAGIERRGTDLVIARKRAEKCLGISVDSFKRGISRLEQLNLITADRHPGRSTVVSIVDYEIYKKYGGHQVKPGTSGNEDKPSSSL